MRRAGRVRARTDVYPEPYHSHKTQSDTVREQSDTVARAASGLSVCGCLRPSCGADDELVSLTCRITLGLSVLEFTESRYKRYRFDTLYHYLIRVPVGQPYMNEHQPCGGPICAPCVCRCFGPLIVRVCMRGEGLLEVVMRIVEPVCSCLSVRPSGPACWLLSGWVTR